jgi:hypothetical protein
MNVSTGRALDDVTSQSHYLKRYKHINLRFRSHIFAPGSTPNNLMKRLTHVSGVPVSTRVAMAVLLKSELLEKYLHRVLLDVMRFAVHSSKPFGRK